MTVLMYVPLSDARKNNLLVRFAQGQSITEIAHEEALRRDSVEKVIREALAQLIASRVEPVAGLERT